MVTLYWLLEYGKVLGGYLFLMYLWPSVVFRKYLRGKSRIFWFSFCVTGQVVLVNTVVLSLGLLHILNRWFVIAVFYGVFLWSLFKDVRLKAEWKKKAKGLFFGTYGIKNFLTRDVMGGLKKGFRRFWEMIRPHFGEYLLLSIVLLYGVVYFSYGAFQDHSYGFGDLYTHSSWIYGLMQGKIFSAGIYPEGMHCFIYCIFELFNVKFYSTLLFLQGIHVTAFLLSAYSLMREVFHIRYTPIFALALFLTLDMKNHNVVASMSRLQWTLPQEFGLHTQFLCALYLIRYLCSRPKAFDGAKCMIGKRFFKARVKKQGKRSLHCWDENLLLFAMALAASVATHFYPMIMAFFLCVAVALFSVKKIFTREHFLPLVTAAVCGLLVAAVPMAGAYASGIKFQGSIGWAMGVINDSMENGNEQENVSENTVVMSPEEERDIPVQQDEIPKKFTERISDFFGRAIGLLKEKALAVYRSGYRSIYQEARAGLVIRITGLTILLWLAYRLLSAVPIFFKKSINRKCFDRYLPMIFASFLYMLAYSAQSVGLPQLVDGIRLCSSIRILVIAVMCMPADMLFSLLALFCRDYILQVLAIIGTVGIYITVNQLGCYHGFLYYELTRYNAAVMVTNSIIDTLPQYSYTIISPTDELYQTILYGRHEELLSFLEHYREESYTLPTEYVFLYVEKRPIRYAQNHFFSGPSWLALDKDMYDSTGTRCPVIDSSEISKEAAQEEIMRFSSQWWTYTNLESRTILESKAYEWCQRFSELYPYEMNVYYEDDDFVCYYFRQEPNAPYNLALE